MKPPDGKFYAFSNHITDFHMAGLSEYDKAHPICVYVEYDEEGQPMEARLTLAEAKYLHFCLSRDIQFEEYLNPNDNL